mmetsp:Transcript_19048/g.45991  ORF Transcript_19048/g.45991 Transcript_19048/m.45991 type:complete len:215 (+) Transcript_19048:306-950(+)
MFLLFDVAWGTRTRVGAMFFFASRRYRFVTASARTPEACICSHNASTSALSSAAPIAALNMNVFGSSPCTLARSSMVLAVFFCPAFTSAVVITVKTCSFRTLGGAASKTFHASVAASLEPSARASWMNADSDTGDSGTSSSAMSARIAFPSVILPRLRDLAAATARAATLITRLYVEVPGACPTERMYSTMPMTSFTVELPISASRPTASIQRL